MTSRAIVAVACIALGGAIAACAEGEETDGSAGARAGDRIPGATAPLGGTQVGTYAISDGAGGVSHVGATLPLAVFAATSPVTATADFPDLVKQMTFFNHIYFKRMPEGHTPTPYLVDHLDLFFYGIPLSERNSISCTNEVMPPEALIPGGYVIASVGGEGQVGDCIPLVGIQALDSTSPELALQNPLPFSKTMVIGYHAGEVSFLEPMVARTTLEARQSFTLAVPRPAYLDRKTLWPTRFDATYDPTTDGYTLVFSEFVPLPEIAPIE